MRRLFENEIPEIADRTIEIKAVAREAGYRSKVAVSSIDLKVDCVGACVGVRGSRIKNIVDELGGERIDIVRWNDSLQVLIPNALQPAEIEEVFLYPRLGRAIVLVKEDQLSLAIGRRGQNVRLASKLVGWDIEIMTHDELTEGIDRATNWFLQIPNMTEELVEAFIEEGFLSYDDLTFLEPAQLGELAGITEDQADEIIAFAEEAAEGVEEETRQAKASGELEPRKAKVKALRPHGRPSKTCLPNDLPRRKRHLQSRSRRLLPPRRPRRCRSHPTKLFLRPNRCRRRFWRTLHHLRPNRLPTSARLLKRKPRASHRRLRRRSEGQEVVPATFTRRTKREDGLENSGPVSRILFSRNRGRLEWMEGDDAVAPSAPQPSEASAQE